MTKKYLAFIATSLLISGSVFSQGDNGGDAPKTEDELQLNTITSAVPFLQIVTDSRSGAMGDAGTALSPTYASTFWNTSMLSFSEDEGAIGLSYSPWLRNITNDVSISTLSGFKKLNARSTVGGSLRYFNLGEITFTDANGMETRTHVPQEFEILGAYAFKLNDEFSLGLNGKFIYSNLTAGQSAAGAITTPGIAGAADLSFSYFNQNVKYGSTNGALAFGLTVNNLGNKIQYTTENDRDFLPTNLKLGAALTFDIDKFNTITWNTDISKLLIPTPPTYVNLE
ncbi:type IX secretion system outer membrane channel protein PorV, partial [Lishizhenia sp.]|uniref:type IX secretion system outer membrane channel protein PorV n=1 Tax=Lishizhenia sp. TaxID=2497594 RepID=UPI00299EB370